MAAPTISVVVAVYNGQDTIGDCLESLLELDYPGSRLERIVVDNASDDATPAILERYRARLTILHERQRGPAAARNTGVRHATGDVVAFTDADCVVDPRWLTHLVAPLGQPASREDDPPVGIVGGRILAHRPCNSICEFGERIHDHRKAIEDVKPPYAITMNWASPRAVLLEIGLFNAGLLRCSDVDLAFRMTQAGYRLRYAHEAVVYHKNRSTLGTLIREGYRHGYYVVPLGVLHGRFVSAYRPRRRPPARLLSLAVTPFRTMRELAARPRQLPWALSFVLAKYAGRAHGVLAARMSR